jgi:hypothetical protein
MDFFFYDMASSLDAIVRQDENKREKEKEKPQTRMNEDKIYIRTHRIHPQYFWCRLMGQTHAHRHAHTNGRTTGAVWCELANEKKAAHFRVSTLMSSAMLLSLFA